MVTQFQRLQLQRPLAIFDLETTGVNPAEDRIVELAMLKVCPSGDWETHEWRLNPGIPIPAAATAVHGISDEDVADRPPFAQIVDQLDEIFKNCDVVGFNIKRFDLPCLAAEFRRTGREFNLTNRAVIDAHQIFHAMEPRTLSAAVRRYLGYSHDTAHSALGDVLATAAVLDAQISTHKDLPVEVLELDRKFRSVDVAGCFQKIEGRIVFNFGKFRGERLRKVAREDPGYLNWILQQSFLDDTKAVVRRALQKAAR